MECWIYCSDITACHPLSKYFSLDKLRNPPDNLLLLLHGQWFVRHIPDQPLERQTSPDPGRDFPASSCDPASTDMDGKRMRLSLHSPIHSPLRQPIAPVRVSEVAFTFKVDMKLSMHISRTKQQNPTLQYTFI